MTVGRAREANLALALRNVICAFAGACASWARSTVSVIRFVFADSTRKAWPATRPDVPCLALALCEICAPLAGYCILGAVRALLAARQACKLASRTGLARCRPCRRVRAGTAFCAIMSASGIFLFSRCTGSAQATGGCREACPTYTVRRCVTAS